jgi:AraC-like DNA-binding protein
MTDANSAGASPDFFSAQVREARRFYLDLAPPPEAAMVVVCGGCETCASDYEIHRSSFPYYSIEFVVRGYGGLHLDGQPFALEPGTVFSYGPGISQDITTDTAEPLVKYFVDFTGTHALALLERHGLAPGSVVQVFAPGEVQSVFDDFVRDGLKGTGYAAALCAALFEYLVLKIADSQIPGRSGQTLAYGTFQRCRQHIVEHCRRLMSLNEVARECHVDRAYLCRLFRRFEHQTPHQFLMRRKMQFAAERLQEPGVLVKEVAAELGFVDPFHFSRVFKGVFGLSPNSFRKMR